MRIRGICVVDGVQVGIHVQGSEIRIGRGSDCDIVLSSKHVSRSHAKIDYHEHCWYVTDMGSRSGTLIRGMPIGGPNPLVLGRTVIQIAEHHLKFVSLELIRGIGLVRAGDVPTVPPARIRELHLDENHGRPVVRIELVPVAPTAERSEAKASTAESGVERSRRIEKPIRPQQAHHLYILLSAGRDAYRRGNPVSMERERQVVDPERRRDDKRWRQAVYSSRDRLRNWFDELRDNPILCNALPDRDSLLEVAVTGGVVAIHLSNVDVLRFPDQWRVTSRD